MLDPLPALWSPVADQSQEVVYFCGNLPTAEVITGLESEVGVGDKPLPKWLVNNKQICTLAKRSSYIHNIRQAIDLCQNTHQLRHIFNFKRGIDQRQIIFLPG